MISPARTPPSTLTLVILTGVTVLSLNMFVPSLVNIAATFDAPYSLVSLSIGGYLAITAVVQIITGPLSDRYGRRPVILWATAIFVLASIGCLAAQSIEAFLGFRMLQAAVVTGGALSRVVVRDVLPPKESATMLSYISMAMAVAPMLGPVLGGALDAGFGWRASFAAMTLMGVAVFWLVWADLGETNAAKSASFAAQFAAYPEVLRSRMFWGYAGCIAFSTGAFFVFIAGSPLVAAELFGVTPRVLGLYVGSITAGFISGSFASARLAERLGLMRMILTGRLIACVGLSLGLILMSAGIVHQAVFFGATICVGIGNGFTMPSANVGVISVRADLAGSASGLAGALNFLLGAVLTSLAGFVVTRFDGDAAAIALLALLLFASAAGGLAALMARGAKADGPLD